MGQPLRASDARQRARLTQMLCAYKNPMNEFDEKVKNASDAVNELM